MSNVRVVAIGDAVVPDDLVAPLGGEECCGWIWLAPIEDVANAAASVAPLISPCCGRRFGVRNLGEVAFVSKAEWESTSDDDETARPETFHVGHAFTLPRIVS